MLKENNIFKKNFYLKAFLLGFLTAFCLFIPYIIVDKGFFTYAGDFNSQQIPFYMYMVRAVHSGKLNYGWAIDLGSSVINSYSFYLLGSPFFWLACLFPYKRIPYLMPFLLMLKFAFCNLGAFGYLKRYSKSDNFALLGALLYTFSGFSVYNIFFNHFIESVVLFPYLLWAVDEFYYSKKRGVLPLIIALSLINNYFFFVGQVVFVIIYFAVKYLSKEYRTDVKEFLQFCFESILGCVMGMILFIPSAISVMQNPRVSNTLEGFGIWMYRTVQQYFAIFASAMLPPDPPYIPSLFTNGNIKWTSMSAFVAFGGMFGFFVFAKSNRRSSFYKIFLICIVCAFVPAFNSAFYAFNSAYYARWFYMALLMLCAMNMQSFAMDKEKIFAGLKITAILTLLLAVFGLTPVKSEEAGWFLGLASEVAIYWLQLLIAILSLYIAYVVVQNKKEDAFYTQSLINGALTVILIFGIVHIGLTKMPQYDADKLYRPQNYDVLDSFSFPDESKNYRMDTYNCYDNLGLFTDIPCIQFFNSTVTPSIMEFYPRVGVKRDVSSKPERSLYALRSLLSVKYLVMPNWEVSNYSEEGNLLNYHIISDSYPYNIYESNYFIPMGFAYDRFVSYEKLEKVLTNNRANILLRAIAIDKEILDKYNLDLDQLPDDDLYDFTYMTYTNDVANRQNMSSYYFNQTKDGFDCKIELENDNLVFFSVPYDEGFTAYVNGQKSEVIKVNYGLSAVYAPAGDNEIVFCYKTPYFTTGLFASGFGVLAWSVYVIILRKNKINK